MLSSLGSLARYQQRRNALTASEFELTLSTDLAAGTAGGGLIVGWKADMIRSFRGRRGAGLTGPQGFIRRTRLIVEGGEAFWLWDRR